MNRIARIALLGLTLVVCAGNAHAHIVCSFDRECLIGKRCTKADYRAKFIKHEEGERYAIVADASVEAIGAFSSFDGEKGTLVARDASAIKPYSAAYALAFSSARAILTITTLDTDDMPYAILMLGACEIEDD